MATTELKEACMPLLQSAEPEAMSSFQLQLLQAASSTAPGKTASPKLQVISGKAAELIMCLTWDRP